MCICTQAYYFLYNTAVNVMEGGVFGKNEILPELSDHVNDYVNISELI